MKDEAQHRLSNARGPLLRTLLFTVIVPGTATILVPRWILAASADEDRPLPLGLRLIGLPLILLGAAVYIRCAWDFAVAGRGTPLPLDPPRELVARGLYRHVRNPMYLGVVSILIGEAIFFSAAALVVYAAAMAAGFHLFIVLYEEPALRRQFGDSYRRYLETVPRWFPRRVRSLRTC